MTNRPKRGPVSNAQARREKLLRERAKRPGIDWSTVFENRPDKRIHGYYLVLEEDGTQKDFFNEDLEPVKREYLWAINRDDSFTRVEVRHFMEIYTDGSALDLLTGTLLD